MVTWACVRLCAQAAPARGSVAPSGSRRARHCRASPRNSPSALCNQAPCAGVSCHATWRAIRRASAGGKRSDQPAGAGGFRFATARTSGSAAGSASATSRRSGSAHSQPGWRAVTRPLRRPGRGSPQPKRLAVPWRFSASAGRAGGPGCRERVPWGVRGRAWRASSSQPWGRAGSDGRGEPAKPSSRGAPHGPAAWGRPQDFPRHGCRAFVVAARRRRHACCGRRARGRPGAPPAAGAASAAGPRAARYTRVRASARPPHP